MPDERSSRLLSLAPQFGSLAVVVALAAALIPAAKNTTGPVAAPALAKPEPVEPEIPHSAFETFLTEAGLAAAPGGHSDPNSMAGF